MEIRGKVIQQIGLKKGTSKAGKEWAKAELVIETEGQYPKKVKLSNMKNAESFALIPTGANGTFHIDIESREYNGRWYTEVSVYKWNLDNVISPEVKAENAAITSQQASYEDFGMQKNDNPRKSEEPEDDEDLPF